MMCKWAILIGGIHIGDFFYLFSWFLFDDDGSSMCVTTTVKEKTTPDL
jgi:hypothetical protein